MASIRDVAKKAGVSITTVSRVINNDKSFSVSEETKNKIFSAINELNYKIPDSYKSNKNIRNSIGCIQRLTIEGNRDNYFSTIASGVKEHLSNYGKSLQFSLTQLDFETDNFESLFQTYPLGIILMGDVSESAYNFLKSKVKYIVGIDTSYEDIDNVRYNRYYAAIQALEHLIDCGHKKIAYIGSNIKLDDIKNIGRYEAYNKVMNFNNLEIKPEWIINCKWHRETCFEETIKLLQSKNRPTAIFVASDQMAIASMAAIHSLGLRIPEDISVVAISDIVESAYLTPPLTTVSIPQKEMGKLATEILLQRINGDSTITKQIFVPCNLVIRNSVKKIN